MSCCRTARSTTPGYGQPGPDPAHGQPAVQRADHRHRLERQIQHERADLLRLNTGIGPTPAAGRSRLGFLTLLDGDPGNDDPAGFPNGRRVSDDVTDIAARAVAGILSPGFNGFPHNRIGDGVNANDADYQESFPYLGYAHSGRDSRHVDPGEPGCTGVCP